jgi:hypothetical protein
MRRKCDISSGPRSGGLATMITDPKESESEAKMIAGQLQNRLPMRDSALRATLGSCTAARCSISSANHEKCDHREPSRLQPKTDDLPPRGIRVRSRTRSLGLTGQQGGSGARCCTSPPQCFDVGLARQTRRSTVSGLFAPILHGLYVPQSASWVAELRSELLSIPAGKSEHGSKIETRAQRIVR